MCQRLVNLFPVQRQPPQLAKDESTAHLILDCLIHGQGLAIERLRGIERPIKVMGLAEVTEVSRDHMLVVHPAPVLEALGEMILRRFELAESEVDDAEPLMR